MKAHNLFKMPLRQTVGQSEKEKSETKKSAEQEKESKETQEKISIFQKMENFFFYLFLFAGITFIVARFLGGDGFDAVSDVIFHSQIGEWSIYLLLIIALLFSISYKKKEWKLDLFRSWLWFFLYLVVIVIISLLIWPNITPRKAFNEVKNWASGDIKEVEVKETKGFRVTQEGYLVANLLPGEEASRSFTLAPGHRTPWIVIPEDHYKYRITNLQTVYVNKKGDKRRLVHPKEYQDDGITRGNVILRIEALPKKGAKVILNIQRGG